MLGDLRFSLVLLTVCWISIAESLECFSCSNIGNSSDCFTVTRCAGDEKCYTEADYSGNNTVYTLGCLNKMQCVTTTTGIPVSIVGRQIHRRSTSMPCQQCCGTNYCNKQLCTHITDVIPTSDQCIDDPDYNCAFIGATFPLCADVEHAKSVCRKFCDLCDYADGGWSSWSTWASCDVSCGQGHHSRTRTCNQPSPAHGGHNCTGEYQEISNCTAGTCPVHGGWSSWAPWGSCSVTCGVGLQRRDRYCSNPYPGPDGNPCFRDSRDDRVCFLGACADGGWSEWSQWSVCSATCDGGTRSRSRRCDNPTPSMFGKQCAGANDDNSICNTHACQDGGWSLWSQWSVCSAICNGGLKERTRNCDNPKPSLYGKSCVGNNNDDTLCNTNACPVPVVIFSVNSPSYTLVGSSTTSGVPVFTVISTNIGDDYNVTSGVFTCRIPGIYQFSVAMTSIISSGQYSSCDIRHNGADVVIAFTHATSSSVEHQSASASTYQNLTLGDTVDLYCNGWQYNSMSIYTMFNGALVAPN